MLTIEDRLLRDINKVRREFGARRLAKLPCGFPGSSLNCPLARSLSDVVPSIRVYDGGLTAEYGDAQRIAAALNSKVYKRKNRGRIYFRGGLHRWGYFVWTFDLRKYQHLIEDPSFRALSIEELQELVAA